MTSALNSLWSGVKNNPHVKEEIQHLNLNKLLLSDATHIYVCVCSANAGVTVCTAEIEQSLLLI